MFASVDFSVYTPLTRVANLAADTSEVGQACTLGWLGATLGFPCEQITPIAAAVVALAVLGVVITWAAKRVLDDASEISFTIRRPRK